MRLHGRLQVFRECGHYLGRHRACASDSQEAILARARSISKLRIAKAALGTNTRVILRRGNIKRADWTLNCCGPQMRAPVTHQFPRQRSEPVVKPFTRDGYARWLLTEMDPPVMIAPTDFATLEMTPGARLREPARYRRSALQARTPTRVRSALRGGHAAVGLRSSRVYPGIHRPPAFGWAAIALWSAFRSHSYVLSWVTASLAHPKRA